MFDLTGKRALVTGASGGIGGAIATALHAQGATVGLSGTRREALESSRRRTRRARPCPALRSQRSEPGREAGRAMPRRPWATSTSWSIMPASPATAFSCGMSDEDWDKVIASISRLPSSLRARRMRGMMRRKSGRIISISSVVAVFGNPGQGNYSASKAGLIGMTRSLAAEVASRGITVNCIAPGFVETAMTDSLNDKQRESILGYGARASPRQPGRGRCRGCLSRRRRGGLCHWPDASRQWRHGHDLRWKNDGFPGLKGDAHGRPERLVKVKKVCYDRPSSERKSAGFRAPSAIGRPVDVRQVSEDHVTRSVH